MSSFQRKCCDNGAQPFDVLALLETKYIVLAKTARVQRETESETAKIIIKLYCPVFWHGH